MYGVTDLSTFLKAVVNNLTARFECLTAMLLKI